MRRSLSVWVGLLVITSWAQAQDATAITYNPLGAGTPTANTIHVSDRLYPYGFALDYCFGQVDGAQDNTVCLQSALNATGVNFQTLEIQPPSYAVAGTATVQAGGTTLTTAGPTFKNLTVGDVICIGSSTYVNCGSGYRTVTFIDPSSLVALQFTPSIATGTGPWSFQGVSTQVNYFCSNATSTPLVWNGAASGRVHVWKGANLSCALPLADSMHIIIDDNVQPLNPYAPTALPAGNVTPTFASYNIPLTLGRQINTATATNNNITGTI